MQSLQAPLHLMLPHGRTLTVAALAAQLSMAESRIMGVIQSSGASAVLKVASRDLCTSQILAEALNNILSRTAQHNPAQMLTETQRLLTAAHSSVQELQEVIRATVAETERASHSVLFKQEQMNRQLPKFALPHLVSYPLPSDLFDFPSDLFDLPSDLIRPMRSDLFDT